MSKGSTIIGWGKYVPSQVLSNADLERMVDTSDEWIVSRTGISERRIAGPDETTGSMAFKAAQNALEKAQINPEDLDLILVCTCSPDYPFPSTACLLQSALGASCPAFDLQAACSGFSYGLWVAHQFIKSGSARHVLVIAADKITHYIDYSDRNTCVLFGDGAGAVILAASETPGQGLLGFSLGADGSNPQLLYVPSGGTKDPVTPDALENKRQYVQMMGTDVFKFATKIIGPSTEAALKEAGLGVEDIDVFIPHQANIRIMEFGAKRLGVPLEKMFVNVAKYGNMSAASVPVALCEAIEQGKVTPGSCVAMVAFGAGLTWGAIVLRWTGKV